MYWANIGEYRSFYFIFRKLLSKNFQKTKREMGGVSVKIGPDSLFLRGRRKIPSPGGGWSSRAVLSKFHFSTDGPLPGPPPLVQIRAS